MKKLLLIAGLLVATTAHAASLNVRPIVLSSSISEPTIVQVPLDEDAQALMVQGMMIVTSDFRSVLFEKVAKAVEYTPSAEFIRAPEPGNTVPPTTLEAIRDNNDKTYFQPITAPEHSFVMKFTSDVTPKSLRIAVRDGRVNRVIVRTGTTEYNMRDAYTAYPSYNNEWFELPGEKARVVEIVLGVDPGLFQLDGISLDATIPEVHFRAAPGEEYSMLFGMDNASMLIPYGGNMREGIRTQPITASLGGATSIPVPPTDFDGIAPEQDNCKEFWNPRQIDTDKDGVGDECDNCAAYANPSQADANGNMLGDECDDSDEDYVQNAVDNCPTVKNQYQEDEDSDGTGNVCDDSDSRFTANKFVLWASLILIVAALLFLATRVLMQAKK